MGESGLSNYVDIARRVKFFGSGSITGSCDEVLQRDSATSAGEDEHDDHARDPMRLGPNSQRVMLRRRRQFDTQGKIYFLKSVVIKLIYNHLLILL